MERFKRIPTILKIQRRYMGMTQKEVAEIVKIPYQDYQKYEYGIHIPRKERYRELCIALGIPITNQIYRLKKGAPTSVNKTVYGF